MCSVADGNGSFYTASFDRYVADYPSDEDKKSQSTSFEGNISVENVLETQVLSLNFETKVLDELECVDNRSTQLIDENFEEIVLDTDDEKSNTAETLEDGKHTESERKCSASPTDKNHISSFQSDAELMRKHDGLFRGSRTPRSATQSVSVNADIAPKEQKLSCPLTPHGHYQEQPSSINIWFDSDCHEKYKKGILDEANRSIDRNEAGLGTARRLFPFESIHSHTTKMAGDGGGDHIAPVTEDGPGGLSYANSQEPGELSQANALECVQKLIDESMTSFSFGSTAERNGRRKPSNAPAAKGSHNLARNAIGKLANREVTVYDWDDLREDEGGGEIFCRLKEDFFSPKSDAKTFNDSRNSKQQSSVGLAAVNENEKEHEAAIAKNLENEFQMADGSIGMGTQLAAEALSGLCKEDDKGFLEHHSTRSSAARSRKSANLRDSRAKTLHRTVNQASKSAPAISRKKGKSFAEKRETAFTESKAKIRVTDKKEPSVGAKFECSDSRGPVATRTRRSLALYRSLNSEEMVKNVNEKLSDSNDRSLEFNQVSKNSKKSSESDSATHKTAISHKRSRQIMSSRNSTCPDTQTKACDKPADAKSTKKLKNLGRQESSSATNCIDKPADVSGITCSSADSQAGSVVLPQNLLGRAETSTPVCITPSCSTAPASIESPVCLGSGYVDPSSRRSRTKSCLLKELSRLSPASSVSVSTSKYSSEKKTLADVRVLFSHHLHDDIIQQQKKVAEQLKMSVASSITDATHFVADKFVRTRNMLEAIASGKPVVTHLWLEAVQQANCYIDEQKYLLRDTKKEKELGFNLPISLQHARQHPLLQGQRVYVTPNTNPGKKTILALVKAVAGQAMERAGRSLIKDGRIQDDVLILSCEEDYNVCVPLLEKGAAVYCSELLLSGIVTQKLEFEKYRLFTDHVKRTRSTLWIKKDDHGFVAVSKHK